MAGALTAATDSGGLERNHTPNGRALARHGPAQEASGLPPEVVRKHIHRVLAQVRYCHQREAKKDPTLAGDLTLELLVAAGGAVSIARVTDTTLPGERVIACVLSVMKRVAFPPLAGGGALTVTPSFTFARFDPGAD